MFEKVKLKIARYLLSKNYSCKNVVPIGFNDIIKKSSSFLVILPGRDDDFKHSFEFLKYLREKGKNVALFSQEHKYNLIPEREKYSFLSYRAEEVTRFFLPGGGLTDRLRGREFDVVIDLNRQEDLFHSAIANIVKTKLRIGFSKEMAERYYNFVVVNSTGDAGSTYKRLKEILEMF